MSMPIRVTILSREDCHLCDVVYRIATASSVRTAHRNEQSVYRQRQRPDGALWDEGSRRLARRGRALRRKSDGRGAAPSDKKSAVEKTYKPDSVPPGICSQARVIISLGFELPRTSSDLPEDLGRASRSAGSSEESRQMSSYLALHRATLTVPVMSPPPRWALTPPFHPYLSQGDQIGIPSLWPSAVCSLWCWCRIAPPGSYPAPCP